MAGEDRPLARSVVRVPAASSRVNFWAQPLLPVYHGTSARFGKFSPSRTGIVSTTLGGNQEVERHGIFFAQDLAFARTFGEHVIAAHLDIRNPMWLVEGFDEETIERLVAGGLSIDTARRLRRLAPIALWQAFDNETGEEVVRAAKRAGYDGALIEEEAVGLGDDAASSPVWVAFDDSQVFRLNAAADGALRMGNPTKGAGGVAGKRLPLARDPVFFDEPHGRPIDVERLRVGDTVYRLSTARRRNMDRDDPASLIFVRSTVRSTDPLDVVRANTSELLPLKDYDVLVVSFSGGKDSLACVLHLLDLGVPRHKIELWHQSVDGDPRAPSRLFDWPVTEDYCRKIAAELGLALYFQWKEGGYQAELLKVNELTKPGRFEMPNGQIGEGGGKATARNKPRTRMMFPQQSADLQTRWCSSSLKIEPADKVFTNDPRFRRGAFVIIGGERREESANRGLYAAVEKHAATTQARRVDRWRPILDWKEGDVWEIIKRHGLRPHPAYEVGFGRCSCMPCIFSNADQWATIKQIAPEVFSKIGALESVFGKTIKAGATVDQQAANGTSYLAADENGEREVAALLAMQETYLGEVRVPVSRWKLPAGAFVRSGGPT